MPLAQISIIAGRPYEDKVKLIEKVTAAIVESLDAPRDTVGVLVTEIPGELWGIGGKPKFPLE